MELKTTFQKLSEEIKGKILEQLKSKDVQEMITKIKEAQDQDTGRFEIIISTGDVDRAGEIIDPNGWDLEFYKMNPVVLWAHDYCSLPIGITENIEVKEGKLVASGKFAPAEANPFAQQVRKLYDVAFVRTSSVGFIAKEMQGNTITKAELLEWSFVPVPANPFALSTLRQSGVDTEALITKGIITKEEPKEGDACTLDDGTEGEYKPNDNGEMVCMPKKETKPEPEITDKYIRIRVKDPEYFDPDSFRTIDISADEGIKAIVGCEKGEYENGKCQVGTEVESYLFDKEKWTLEDAQAWVDEHKKSQKQKEENLATQIGAELTEMQSKIDAAIIEHSKKIVDLLSEKSIAALNEKLQGNKPGDGANNGREPAGLKDLEEYLFFRQILQKVDKVIEDGLRRTREKIRPSKN